LEALVEEQGGHIREFLVCPHGPDDGCSCRKPAPGLFFRARDELGVNLAEAVMVGDQIWDVQAARAAGCDAILIDSTGGKAHAIEAAGLMIVSNLAAAADLICAD
jgi:D-glycero-D-manno-heptose 1,7-bisphosphate phosphatase